MECLLLDVEEPQTVRTSLNWSHNGSKDYTIESSSQNRYQWPLTNCHTAETVGNDGGKMTLDLVTFPNIYLSIKWIRDMTNGLFKRLTPL